MALQRLFLQLTFYNQGLYCKRLSPNFGLIAQGGTWNRARLLNSHEQKPWSNWCGRWARVWQCWFWGQIFRVAMMLLMEEILQHPEWKEPCKLVNNGTITISIIYRLVQDFHQQYGCVSKNGKPSKSLEIACSFLTTNGILDIPTYSQSNCTYHVYAVSEVYRPLPRTNVW